MTFDDVVMLATAIGVPIAGFACIWMSVFSQQAHSEWDNLTQTEVDDEEEFDSEFGILDGVCPGDGDGRLSGDDPARDQRSAG